jgi:ABC-type phosphate/phosphonate transport system ATPase subunit
MLAWHVTATQRHRYLLFVAIIGRSGAGKTTLLHCLSRGTVVTEGHVRFGACDLAALHGEMLRRHRARVGMIYQQFNLVKCLHVLDNVLIGRLSHLGGMSWWFALARRFSPDDQQIVLRCLDHVGLLSRAWQRTDTLSGGEQQRVAVAKVLSQQPKVILADEPVASLDLKGLRVGEIRVDSEVNPGEKASRHLQVGTPHQELAAQPHSGQGPYVRLGRVEIRL